MTKTNINNTTLSKCFTITLLSIVILMSSISLNGTKIWESEQTLWLHAVTLSPYGAKANNNYGNVLFRTHKTVDAIPYYKRAIESFPAYADAQYNLATSYLKIGQYQKSLPIFDAYLKLEPDSIDGNFNLGFVYSQLGNLEGSINQFQKVLLLDKNNVEAKRNLKKLLAFKQSREVLIK